MTDLKGISNVLERPEGDHLLEEVECGVACLRVREVRDRRRTRPRDDRGEEDANEQRTLDAVKHQEHGEDTVQGKVVSARY